MSKVIRVILIAIFWPLSGCSASMTVEDMTRVFQDDLNHAVGFTHEQLKHGKFQIIGSRNATEQRRLENGNMLYVYGDYWVQYEIPRTPCDVYIEVDPETDDVVNAYAKGSGCYRPY